MPTLTRRPNSPGFIASFPHQAPATEEGTDVLPVNGVEGANQWTPVGNLPYLDAIDDVNRIETATDTALSYEFTFADSTFPAGATILLVRLSVYCVGDGNDYVGVEIWDGSAWTYVGDIIPPSSYDYRQIDVEAVLDSRTKIDAAKVRFTYHKSAGANIIKIDYAQLGIQWLKIPPHWQLVDDVTPDGDATSIWTSEEDSMTYSDLYNIPDITLPEGAVIDKIEVFNHAKASIVYEEAYPQLCIFMRTYDTNYASPAIQLTSDVYHDESYVWTINPFTGNAWTEEEINALQIGCRGNSVWLFAEVFNAVHVTQVYVIITYHLPAAAKIGYGNGFVCVSVG